MLQIKLIKLVQSARDKKEKLFIEKGLAHIAIDKLDIRIRNIRYSITKKGTINVILPAFYWKNSKKSKLADLNDTSIHRDTCKFLRNQIALERKELLKELRLNKTKGNKYEPSSWSNYTGREHP